MKPMSAKKLDQTPLLHLLGYNLRRASVLFMTDFNELLRPWNLSPTEFTILLLVENNEDLTQAMLCRTLGVKGANMTPMVNHLEKQGFIKRIVDPADRRQPKIRITANAVALMPEWKTGLQSEERRLQGTLTKAEKAHLLALLQKIWLTPSN
jgi:DNA-binding MarR family transcriptional regulator